MRCLLLLSALAVACGSATSKPVEKTCAAGEFPGPLNTCAIDRLAPPCRCLNTAFCCHGDECAGPLRTDASSCSFLCITCESGTLHCKGGTLSISDQCKPLD